MTWAVMGLATALGLALPAMAAERGPLRTPSSALPSEDPDGARVIVKFKALGSLMRAQSATGATGTVPAKGPQHAATLARRHGLALRDGRIIDGRSQVVRGDRGLSSAALAARLAADPEVEYAVPEQRRRALVAPNDPLYAANTSTSPAVGQWYLRAPDATAVSAINAEGAWAISTGAASIVVADVDTGVLFDHPDLASKLYPGYDFIADSSNAGDGGGRDSNAADPGDFTNPGECGPGSSADSSSWHGTQTSSLIGAQTGNGIGMASVGYNVMLLPVRVLGKCGGYDSDIIAGMLWAGGVSSVPVANPHPARVINMSLGGPGSCNGAYVDAVSQLGAAGVVVVASAGNDVGLAVGTPANCPGVIAVAGVRHVGTKVGFSSIGPQVAIAAPGGNCVNTTGPCLYPILTATNSGATVALANTYSDSTNYSVGTSFAAPLVAGTAALMLSANPSLTPTQVKALLMSSARPFPTTSTDPSVLQCVAPTSASQGECICTTSTCGAGLLDAAAAVSSAAISSIPVARIGASASSVSVGASVSFNGSGSTAPSGRSIAFYSWA
ncbi:MAG: S8 family peptidase, partial [Burkholderiales bacterium]|nr:S8 family peptidase [Burkholderiales bacterium]